ncbi:hypothetical protein CDA63_04895 [Hymenobacter amundsenii]|uniref:TonB C-terminal domain-containing protein n=1 Tax=Hymenobacter amundsenii TaxID=2006685 RepID=A0A246FNR4_9BACT|nr:hypothetical protein [Hymenobacter amundsenii]OWP64373.1 hypothetical protein CDA63_04895 [Hymenobacter amundsenii]
MWVGFLGAATVATAQTNPALVPMPNASAGMPGPQLVDGEGIYTYVEKMPVYLDGGMEGLQAAITSRVHHGAASGPQAFVSFVVDWQGNIRNPTFRSTGMRKAIVIDPALVEAFAGIGKFRPGTQNGKPVNVELSMPIVKRSKK